MTCFGAAMAGPGAARPALVRAQGGARSRFAPRCPQALKDQGTVSKLPTSLTVSAVPGAPAAETA